MFKDSPRITAGELQNTVKSWVKKPYNGPGLDLQTEQGSERTTEMGHRARNEGSAMTTRSSDLNPTEN